MCAKARGTERHREEGRAKSSQEINYLYAHLFLYIVETRKLS